MGYYTSSPEPTYTQIQGPSAPLIIPPIILPADPGATLEPILIQAGVSEAVPLIDYATSDLDDVLQVQFVEAENMAVAGETIQQPIGAGISVDLGTSAEESLAGGTFLDPYIVSPVSVATPALLDTYNVKSQNNWSIGAFAAALIAGYILYKVWK